MKVQRSKHFSPITITIETEEELKHFVACLAVSDNDRKDSARTCGFHLNEDHVDEVSTRIWQTLKPEWEMLQNS